MPYDASGNFSRLYNWQNDRDNNIKILSSRMDQEFDNYAAALNQAMLRNGLTPLTGNLNVAQNYIVGLGAGSTGALSMRFGDDGATGLYLNGPGKLGLAAGGAQRLEVGTTAVRTAVPFIAQDSVTITGATAQLSLQDRSANSDPAAPWIMYADAGAVRLFARGGDRFSVNQDGNGGFSGSLDVAGALRNAGNQVYHTGNFNPANYAPLAGAVFSGNINVSRAGGASIGIQDSGATQFGIVAVGNNMFIGVGGSGIQIDSANNVYVQQLRTNANGTGKNVLIGDDVWLGDVNDAYTMLVAGAADPNSGFIRFGGNTSKLGVASGGALTFGGQTVYHAGNLSLSAYAPINSPTLQNSVNIAGATSQLHINDRTLPNDTTHGWAIYSQGDILRMFQSTVGLDRLTVDAIGNMGISGNFNCQGITASSVQVNGASVWHTNNFNPANYQPAGSYTSPNTNVVFRDVTAARAANEGVAFLGSTGNTWVYAPGDGSIELVIQGTKVAKFTATEARFRGNVIANLGASV